MRFYSTTITPEEYSELLAESACDPNIHPITVEVVLRVVDEAGEEMLWDRSGGAALDYKKDSVVLSGKCAECGRVDFHSTGCGKA